MVKRRQTSQGHLNPRNTTMVNSLGFLLASHIPDQVHREDRNLEMPIVLDKNLKILSLFKGSGKGQPRKINDFLIIVTLLQPNIKKNQTTVPSSKSRMESLDFHSCQAVLRHVNDLPKLLLVKAEQVAKTLISAE